MADRKKPPTPAPSSAVFLSDDLVAGVTEAVAASLGSSVMGLAESYGVSLEDVIRFQAVTRRCVEAREKTGLSLKDVAKQLGAPQYRIRDIESGSFKQIDLAILRTYLEMLGLTSWYAEWSQANPALANRLAGNDASQIRRAKPQSSGGVCFRGEVVAVKARIRLIRSFDQISHQYQGYTLVIAAGDTEAPKILRVAIGPAAHLEHQFRIGDVVSGKAQPVPNPNQEWATLYKTSGLKVERRGLAQQDRPPDPEGGIASPLEVYRDNGHRRLDPRICQTQCPRCPWGLTMATEIIVDHWNPSKKRWRFETHCYGPRDCPRYRAGAPRKVPGRKPGMVWIDNDIEREGEW